MGKRKLDRNISTALPKGRKNVDISTRLPVGTRGEKSILKNETWQMEAQRREDEKESHRRRLGVKVHDKIHHEPQENAPEGELQNNIKEHPYMNQRHDGTSPNESEVPYLNPDARREYDNAQREQQLQKQLQLGLMPKMGSAPEFKP